MDGNSGSTSIISGMFLMSSWTALSNNATPISRPQTVFVLPAGYVKVASFYAHAYVSHVCSYSILYRNSENTLALSLWSLDASGAFIAGIELIADAVFSTALDIQDYMTAPDYFAQAHLRPVGQAVTPM